LIIFGESEIVVIGVLEELKFIECFIIDELTTFDSFLVCGG